MNCPITLPFFFYFKVYEVFEDSRPLKKAAKILIFFTWKTHIWLFCFPSIDRLTQKTWQERTGHIWITWLFWYIWSAAVGYSKMVYLVYKVVMLCYVLICVMCCFDLCIVKVVCTLEKKAFIRILIQSEKGHFPFLSISFIMYCK